MNSKRPLAPGFLNRLDHSLLINKPEAWSARTHLVMYYGLLFLAALTFISFIIPNDPRSSSPLFYWVGFLVIISIIALTGWLIYLLRFNVFKRYGNITPLSGLITFMLYFIAVGTLFLFPLVMPYVESVRANNAYSDQEVINDINAINIKICQLEYDSLPHTLGKDTIVVVNHVPLYRSMPQDNEVDSVVTTTPLRYRYRLVNRASLSGQISEADSSVRLNDSMYVLYKSSQYEFISSYTISSYTNNNHAQPGVYSSYDLYKKIIRNFSPPNRRAARTELYRLLTKYKLDEATANRYEYEDYEAARDIYQKIRKKYELYTVNRNIDHVTERKYRWRGKNAGAVVRLWYYATLIITLLVFMYRHSTKKTFFLSLLTAFILTVLSSIFAAYITGQKSSGYLWPIAYTVLFFVISLVSFRTKTRQLVTGIGTNLFVLMVAFFPLCLVGYYYSVIEEKNRTLLNANYMDYDAMSRNMWYAELAGSLLLLILLATYIQRVYRKWYASPEE